MSCLLSTINYFFLLSSRYFIKIKDQPTKPRNGVKVVTNYYIRLTFFQDTSQNTEIHPQMTFLMLVNGQFMFKLVIMQVFVPNAWIVSEILGDCVLKNQPSMTLTNLDCKSSGHPCLGVHCPKQWTCNEKDFHINVYHGF